MAQAEKYTWSFGTQSPEGDGSMREILGGKGANLCEMSRLGMPVPPGFVIGTHVCVHYFKNDYTFPFQLHEQVEAALKQVELATARQFGDHDNPLLLSVRSGARMSMPGMMDTILNLGLNSDTVEALARQTGDERFALDCYRRFIQMYADVVLGIKHPDTDPFDEILSGVRRGEGVEKDFQISPAGLRSVIAGYKKLVRRESGHDFPESVQDQLWGAVSAVFKSWMNPRAEEYRRMYDIPAEWGTAVNIMAMVFGNMGDDSATGVAFSRSPATGEKQIYGEFLKNAQGEDVVAGIRTPEPVEQLDAEFPAAWKELREIMGKLETHYRDMQDIEFTIEKGRLWMLQCRNGKRTGQAAIRIAMDMEAEGLINQEEALSRLDADSLNQILQPVFERGAWQEAVTGKNEKGEARLLGKGLNAGPGAATGHIALTHAAVDKMKKEGKPVILVRSETSPEDIKAMKQATGILTAHGGMTSHAALIARQMGKVCVVGCGDLEIDLKKKEIHLGGRALTQGELISLNGFTGEVVSGEVASHPSGVVQKYVHGKTDVDDPDVAIYEKIMGWADEARQLKVFANADQPGQCREALALGAEGIGLVRTEHMFFGEERITAMRSIILAPDTQTREGALRHLAEFQESDFYEIFKVMTGKPVTIRTLDPPLHEFMPHKESEEKEVAAELGIDVSVVRAKMEELKEANPMLGLRGCRLGIVFPEIITMQAEAMLRAACRVRQEGLAAVDLHIMVPLVTHVYELEAQKIVIDQAARHVFGTMEMEVPYKIGSMIEIPRACIAADAISRVAEFFSFGTNDLTQTTLGLSRDDSGAFLPYYLERGIYPIDPFATVDQHGVGQLMELAVERGRKTRPDLEIGICGEQGGDPKSVEFCHNIGLSYVSCSAFRVPVARLAAAQAAIKNKR